MKGRINMPWEKNLEIGKIIELCYLFERQWVDKSCIFHCDGNLASLESRVKNSFLSSES